MSQYADLEIVFRKHDEQSYALSFRFNSLNDATEKRSLLEPVISIDSARLTGDDAQAYADALTAAFFTPEVRGEFGKCRAAAATQSAVLRVRLSIDSNASELHAIHWETLRDPDLPADRLAPLFAGEQTVVSRFLNSGDDWHVLGGLQTGAANLVQSTSGINVFNAKLGARASFSKGSSIYAGYGRGLTSDSWYRNLFRIEYRRVF